MRAVSETDTSGIRLLEARLGLAWEAEGLDLTSPNTAPPYLHSYPYKCILLRYTPKLSPTRLLTLPLHTRYLKHTAVTQIPSQPLYLPVMTPFHAHSFPTNMPLSASTRVTPHLSSILLHLASICEDLLWERSWVKLSVTANQVPQGAPSQLGG